MFLLRELFKAFCFPRRPRIGFVTSELQLPYNKIMASTRLRVYDVINMFRGSKDYFLELYKPFKSYDVVIFQKYFNQKAYSLAKKLKENNGNKVKVVLDINVNYYDKSWQKAQGDFDNVIKFTEIADVVVVTADYLRDFIKNMFPNKEVVTIFESIPDVILREEKEKGNAQNNDMTFVYNGYAEKAKEILVVRPQLESLALKYKISYLFICEKSPDIKINNVECVFLKHNQSALGDQLRLGDVFLSPRDLKNSYNLGHSFTKIGTPMAAGLPVIASPVPSYVGSPAILIDDFSDNWSREIEKLILDAKYYKAKSAAGVEYCKNYFSTKIIAGHYKKLFASLIK